MDDEVRRQAAWQHCLRARMNVRYYESVLDGLAWKRIVVDVAVAAAGLAGIAWAQGLARLAIGVVAVLSAFVVASFRTADLNGRPWRHALMLARYRGHMACFEQIFRVGLEWPGALTQELSRYQETRLAEVDLIGAPNEKLLRSAEDEVHKYADEYVSGSASPAAWSTTGT